MKKAVLLFSLLTVMLTLQAQMEKGRWMVGGLAEFSHADASQQFPTLDGDNKITTLRILPGAGYFFADRLCAGLRLSASTAKNERHQVGSNPVYTFDVYFKSTTTALGISPFIRYYWLPTKSKLNVFADAGFLHTRKKIKSYFRNVTQLPGGPFNSSEGGSTEKTNSNYIPVAAGPVLLISKKVSFEISAGYLFGLQDRPGQHSGALSIGSGFQVYFGR